MTFSRRLYGVFALAAMLVTGCDSGIPDWPVERLPLVPVAGTLTLDRRPLAEARLLFFCVDDPQRWPSVAVTDAQGSFRIRTYDQDDGAPEGAYRVTVSWKGPRGQQNADDYESLPEKLPRRYQAADGSGLFVTITAGVPQLAPLELSTR